MLKKCSYKRPYVWIGTGLFAFGATIYYFKTPHGKKTMEKARQCKRKTAENIAFIKENYGQIFKTIENTVHDASEHITAVVDEVRAVSSSVKKINDNLKQLRNETTDALAELKKLKEGNNY